MNTRITYLYRDACNYKQYNEVIVSGIFTELQINDIINCLDEGTYFIPNQIGFPEIRFGEITEEDHCWFELSRNGFEATDAKPDISMSSDEVVDMFLNIKGNWNEEVLKSNVLD